ncbi:hypothetical protein BU23DRAFT_261086 [Bimuria novae-zelandiae CBS 107.79]|uniref:Uncharacterized protein n=1 Tax=Bimuria novae-zelandiae CBS 107.79 TaxID=1447943 RepID=A0A6A5UUW1_9PLEO|nr:hypothetical protein BU23DRAFT_261086 [Bimuria novae-zelandiae CBS 107.79]
MVSTRTSSYGTESQEPDTRPGSLSARRERWAHLLRAKHYQLLIAEVLEREMPKYVGSNILPSLFSSRLRECTSILASASSIFAAAVDGTLTQRLLEDSSLQREYARIRERAHTQPSIYIHLLIDERSIAPTANQYSLIREAILQYISSGSEYQDLAWAIDNITPPPVRHSGTVTGYRKYLWTSHRSRQHLETLLRFCEGILRRVTETPLSQRDTPMKYPPTECGYSINSHVRLEQHRQRHFSNYVMNLVEDVCGYLHQVGKLSQRFTMHPFIIYLIFYPEQAAMAEIFCSGLLQVWIEEGGGLNAYPAGRSVASARRVSGSQWGDHERWISENTDFLSNMRVQRDRLESDVAQLEWATEEAWREALNSEDGDDPKDLDYVPG